MGDSRFATLSQYGLILVPALRARCPLLLPPPPPPPPLLLSLWRTTARVSATFAGHTVCMRPWYFFRGRFWQPRCPLIVVFRSRPAPLRQVARPECRFFHLRHAKFRASIVLALWSRLGG